jgi:hypothetical protein
VTYVLQSRLQWIRFDFISETAWAILEGVVETERVGCVRNGCLYGCFGRDDTKRRFLMHWMSKDRKKGGGCVQTMAEWVECMRTRVGFVVCCVRDNQIQRREA